MNHMVSIFAPQWRRLIRIADLSPGIVLVKRIRGLLIGAANDEDRIYVFEAICPHAGQSLEGLKVCGGVVVCPRHGLTLGLARLPCSANARPVTHLPYRVRNGIVEVDLRARTGRPDR